MEVAKAIEEEERNIGVAFIPPFTLTCVCVCVCVCVYVCTTEFEDRVLVIIHAQTKQKKKDIFFRRVLFSSVLLDFTSMHTLQ